MFTYHLLPSFVAPASRELPFNKIKDLGETSISNIFGWKNDQ